jgi:hypothetical protein
MIPIHIDECDPKTQALARAQISGTEGGTAALATVVNDSFTALSDPATMTDDRLAGVVIEGVKKLRAILPYVVALKIRFDEGRRDSFRRLVNPIGGCHSWRDFCNTHLDRAPQTVNQAFAASKAPQILEPAEWQSPAVKEVVDWMTARTEQGAMGLGCSGVRVSVRPEGSDQEKAKLTFGFVEPSLAKGLIEFVMQSRRAQTPSAPEPALQPIIDADFVGVPAVPAPITFKELWDWHNTTPEFNDGLLYLSKTSLEGHQVDLTISALAPATAKLLAEYYLQLKKVEPQPPADPAADPAPIPEPAVVRIKHQRRIPSPGVHNGLTATWCGLHHRPETLTTSDRRVTCPACIAARDSAEPQPTSQAEEPTPMAPQRKNRTPKQKMDTKSPLLQAHLGGALDRWVERAGCLPDLYTLRQEFFNACEKAGTSVAGGRRMLANSEHISEEVRQAFRPAATNWKEAMAAAKDAA